MLFSRAPPPNKHPQRNLAIHVVDEFGGYQFLPIETLRTDHVIAFELTAEQVSKCYSISRVSC